MNFLEKAAFRKVERVLAPRLAAGETILEFDIGSMNSCRTSVVATNRAVYIGPAGSEAQSDRLGYENVAFADGTAGRLRLLTHDGQQVDVQFDRGLRGVVPIIQGELACLDDYSVDVTLANGTATLRYRAWRDQVISSWTVTTSPANLSPDDASASMLVAARKAAGEHVVSRSRKAPDTPVTAVGAARDWSAPVDAWLDWCGDRSGLVAFVEGHVVQDGWGESRLLILTAKSLHMVGFPALVYPSVYSSLIPHEAVPLRRLAVWEIHGPEAGGNRLVRLLVIDEGSMSYWSVDAAYTYGETTLLMLGFPPVDGSLQFINALVEKVDSDGVYGRRAAQGHPLDP